MTELKQAVLLMAVGFLVISGSRLAEYVFEKPPTKLLICVAEADGKVGHCTDFSDYVTQPSKP